MSGNDDGCIPAKFTVNLAGVKTDAHTEIYRQRDFLPSARFPWVRLFWSWTWGPEIQNFENALTVKKFFSPAKFTVNLCVDLPSA
jgi:hypothetical protein